MENRDILNKQTSDSTNFNQFELTNLISYLGKGEQSASILIDKVKTLTNVLLKKGVFQYMHSLPLADTPGKAVKSGSITIEGYTLTSVQTVGAGKTLKSIYGRQSISNRQSNAEQNGIVKAFLFTIEQHGEHENKSFEAKLSMFPGKDSTIKYLVN